jgi:hypothetical protein
MRFSQHTVVWGIIELIFATLKIHGKNVFFFFFLSVYCLFNEIISYNKL